MLTTVASPTLMDQCHIHIANLLFTFQKQQLLPRIWLARTCKRSLIIGNRCFLFLIEQFTCDLYSPICRILRFSYLFPFTVFFDMSFLSFETYSPFIGWHVGIKAAMLESGSLLELCEDWDLYRVEENELTQQSGSWSSSSPSASCRHLEVVALVPNDMSHEFPIDGDRSLAISIFLLKFLARGSEPPL